MDVLVAVQEAVAGAADRVGPAVVAVGGRQAAGSGFVVADGKVVTNAHHVGGDAVHVVFADGREAEAEVLGVDVDGDLAVLAVDTAGVAPVRWCEADADIGLGTAVLALARHHRGTLRVTAGWVAATGRSFRGPRGRRIEGAFEHTAPLAHGSSGGPVVDRDGRVVGVDTDRVGQGFYLARPATTALRDRVEALARGESPQRRRLGVVLAPGRWARHARAALGLEPREGLLVGGVVDDSSAARAGLRRGDLVVRAADTEVRTLDDLQAVLDTVGDGDTLTLVVVRGEEETTVPVSFAQP